MPKILIIRFSSIGDIVLTTPVIRMAKEQIPGAEIHYLTKSTFVDVIKANPYIDKIHAFNDSWKEIIPQLRRENFDFIADLHNNLRSMRVKRALGIPSKSFRKLNREKWIMVNFKKNRLPDMNIVERYLEVFEQPKLVNDRKGLDHFIPESEEVNIESTLPPAFHHGYIGFVIGASYYTKMYPMDKVVEVIRKLQTPVVLLGGPGDRENGESVRKRFGNAVFNACGQFSINQSSSLVRQARRIITNDTGLMHIAAAFNKPTLSIWGNTIPEFGMFPYMPEHEERSKIMEVKDLNCRPCSKLGHGKCPKKHFYCMNLINTSEIAEWADSDSYGGDALELNGDRGR